MGKSTRREAVEVLDLSLRHVMRLLAAYREEGGHVSVYYRKPWPFPSDFLSNESS